MQWSRLGVWARVTGQPDAVRQAIFQAEHLAAIKSSGAEAKAVEMERRAREACAARVVA